MKPMRKETIKKQTKLGFSIERREHPRLPLWVVKGLVSDHLKLGKRYRRSEL